MNKNQFNNRNAYTSPLHPLNLLARKPSGIANLNPYNSAGQNIMSPLGTFVMPSHPGKPGYDLPVVMPGIGAGDSPACNELKSRLRLLQSEKKEYEFKIKSMNRKVSNSISPLRSIPSIANDLSNTQTTLSGIASLAAMLQAEKLIRIVQKLIDNVLKPVAGIALVISVMSALKVINVDLKSYNQMLKSTNREIREIQDKMIRQNVRL
ncbi:MAG: hypothetical protein R3261_04640 [Alphaproteobacteria bacterium]|nr:hypothetical protein [Alphaproteobacteria bacterium]